MTWSLRTLVYDAQAPWQDITDVARGLLLRSALQGGLQSIEFEIADDWQDSYRWAIDHIGSKVYVFDNAVNPPVAEGRILDCSITEQGNTITAFGPWLAYCYNQVYNNTSDWYSSGQTGAQVDDILTDECPEVSTNQDNTDEPATNNFPWQPSGNRYPGDLIEQLAALSDSSNNAWYFWLRSAPLSGMTPNDPIPYFKAETSITQVYQCWREDMQPGGLELMPSLRDLANDVRVMYRNSAGRQRQTASTTDADSISRYWRKERYDFDLGLATATAANQYRNLLLARYKDIVQSASFTVNTWAYDQYGGKWPLWRVIADFPVKWTVNDLIPDSTVLGHTLDDKRTFITLAAEYDYDTNSLRIVPDTQDTRADALLARHRALQ